MPPQNQQLQEAIDRITRLESDISDLKQNFYKNNFSSSQIFNKDCTFTTKMKVPHYSSAPSVGEVGDLIEVGGILYICTTAGNVASPATFTGVGTQT